VTFERQNGLHFLHAPGCGIVSGFEHGFWSMCSSSLKSQPDVFFTLMSPDTQPPIGRYSNFENASPETRDIDSSSMIGIVSIPAIWTPA
jgi:hypothetical protein